MVPTGAESQAEAGKDLGQHPPRSGLDARMHDALTDLYAYALVLDAEWRRLGGRRQELSASGTDAEQQELDRRRSEIGEELDALRRTILALRTEADPTWVSPKLPRVALF
jgi:hypothetical protein